MTRWTGIVAVPAPDTRDEMMSRLPAHLHPVCGRPLVWHAVSVLLSADPSPEHVYVVGDADLPEDLCSDLAGNVTVLPSTELNAEHLETEPRKRVVVHAAAVLPPSCIAALIDGPDDAWIAARDGQPVAVRSSGSSISVALDPAAGAPLATPDVVLVRDRAGLAEAHRVVRDRIVRQLMRGGATFILPDSVTVDVDVSIGRDTVIYPGAVIEGQTTIGGETVVGPGCRIISSWIGSGVELKGWNYIAHTSIRNRAILEPYVRRGFD